MKCFYCSCEATTIDHVIPKSALRRSWVKLTAYHHSINRVPCCAKCNAKKKDMHPHLWAERLPNVSRDSFDHLLQLLPVSLVYAETSSRKHWA